MRASLMALVAVLLWSGCSGDGDHDVKVQVVTSAVAGPQFNNITVELLAPNDVADILLKTSTRAATFGEAFSRGVVVADFEHVSSGLVGVRVRLFSPDGLPILQRKLITNVTKDTTIVVPLSIDCLDVVCPGEGDAAGGTECLAGRCVDPRCDPSSADTAQYCNGVDFCNANDDCAAPAAACAEALCVTGICTSTPTDGIEMCIGDTWCDPLRGCRELDVPGDDAGMDGGVGTDGGMRCQRCTDYEVSGQVYRVCEDVQCPSQDELLDASIITDASSAADGSGLSCRVCEFVRVDESDGDAEEIGLICREVSCDSLVRDGGSISDAGDGGRARCNAYIGGGSYGDFYCDEVCGGQFCDPWLSGSGYHVCSIPAFCSADGGIDAADAGDAGADAGGAGDASMSTLDASDDAASEAAVAAHDAAISYTYGGDAGVVSGCRPDELRWRYKDDDHDGYGGYSSVYQPPSYGRLVCPLDPDYVDQQGDHEYSNASMHPGATEACDGVDNNGDDIIDGSEADTWCGTGKYCLGATCVDASSCTPITGEVNGAIADSGIWCGTSNTITIRGNVTIRPEARVIIPPGTTVRMKYDTGTSAVASITVRGALEFHGTAGSPIIVQSDASSPTRSDWGSITGENISGPPLMQAEYTRFRHSNTVTNGTMFVASHCEFEQNRAVTSGRLTMRNCTSYSNMYGAAWPSGTPNVYAFDSAFFSNTFGGSMGGSMVLVRSEVHDNDVAFGSSAEIKSYYSSVTDNMLLSGIDAMGMGSQASFSLFPEFAYTLIAHNGSGLADSLSNNGAAMSPVSSNPLSWTGDYLAYNTICDNGGYEFSVNSVYDKYVRNNYWCTTDSSTINGYIYDFADMSSNGRAYFSPFLTSPDPLTPADGP